MLLPFRAKFEIWEKWCKDSFNENSANFVELENLYPLGVYTLSRKDVHVHKWRIVGLEVLQFLWK